MKKVLTISLEEKEIKRIKKCAKNQDLSVSEYIRQSLERF